MKVLYRTKATASGGRAGHVRSDDGALALDLAIPAELGGRGGAANPEQLFAAGYAACFENAILHVAARRKLKPSRTQVSAEVGLGQRPDGGFALTVALEAVLGGLDPDTARELVEAAHRTCPYSNAVRGNIDVALTVRVE